MTVRWLDCADTPPGVRNGSGPGCIALFRTCRKMRHENTFMRIADGVRRKSARSHCYTAAKPGLEA